MELIETTNLLVRLLLEVFALIALGYWGFRASSNRLFRSGLMIVAPLTAAVVWAVFASPNAPVELPGVVSLAIQVLVLGTAAIGLAAAGRPRWAAIFAVIAVINALLIVVWDQ